MADSRENQDFDALRDDAYAWVIRIRSGEATADETVEMMRWRARSPAHQRALNQAIGIHRRVLFAGRLDSSAPQQSPFGAARRHPAHPLMSRRAVLGGAIAASAAGAMIVRPPLGLWPSLAELRADYRTTAGERRTISLAQGVSVELNTRTSVALRSDARTDGLDLISGEVAIDAVHPHKAVAIRTDTGSARSGAGRFTVRLDGTETCVTCLAGKVAIAIGTTDKAVLMPGQQLRFAEGKVGNVAMIDPVRAESWRRGVLIFGGEPMAQVVGEVNRYRAGKIILANSALSDIPVNAVFQIDRMDRAVSLLRTAAGARATNLPGGIVVLS